MTPLSPPAASGRKSWNHADTHLQQQISLSISVSHVTAFRKLTNKDVVSDKTSKFSGGIDPFYMFLEHQLDLHI